MSHSVKLAPPYQSKFFHFLMSLDNLDLTPFLVQEADGKFRPGTAMTSLVRRNGNKVTRDVLVGIAKIAVRLSKVTPPLLVARFDASGGRHCLKVVTGAVAEQIHWVAVPEGNAAQWLAALVATERNPDYLPLAALVVMALSPDRPNWFDGRSFLAMFSQSLIGSPGFYDRIDRNTVH